MFIVYNFALSVADFSNSKYEYCIYHPNMLYYSCLSPDDMMIGDAKDYPPHIINAVALRSWVLAEAQMTVNYCRCGCEDGSTSTSERVTCVFSAD